MFFVPICLSLCLSAVSLSDCHRGLSAVFCKQLYSLLSSGFEYLLNFYIYYCMAVQMYFVILFQIFHYSYPSEHTHTHIHTFLYL